MVRNVTCFLIFIIFFSLLFSCGSELQESQSVNYKMDFVTISTIPDGAQIFGNALIPIHLTYESAIKDIPDKIMVSISNKKSAVKVIDLTYVFNKTDNRYIPILYKGNDYGSEVESSEILSLDQFKEKKSPSKIEKLSSDTDVESPSGEPSDGLINQKAISSSNSDSDAGFDEQEKSLAKIAEKGSPSEDHSVERKLPNAKEGRPSTESELIKKPQYELYFKPPMQDKECYDLSISFFSKDEFLGTKEVPFFFSDNSVEISAVEILPLVVYPGGEALALLDLSSTLPEQSWVQVSFNKKPLISGLLSDIGDMIRLKAPLQEDVYSLSVEIFPMPPASSEDKFTFSSPYKINCDLFVSKNQSKQVKELNTAGQYEILHHFRGELNNVGKSGVGTVYGSPLLDLADGFFGYRFNSKDMIVYEGLNLPVQQGKLLPFSIQISSFFPEAGEGLIYTAGNDSFIMRLKTDKKGLPQLLVRQNENLQVSSLPQSFKPEDFSFRPLTVSVFPWHEKMVVLWYKDGQLISRDQLVLSKEKILSEGYSILGGNDSFRGIIDEFGLSTKNIRGEPSICSDLFNLAMQRSLRTNLVFAEGFDSLYQADYNYNVTGEAELSGSRLTLKPGAKWHQSILLDGSDILNVNLDLEVFSGSNVTFNIIGLLDNQQTNLISLDFKEGLYRVGKKTNKLASTDGLFSFSIDTQGETVKLLVGNKTFIIGGDEVLGKLVFECFDLDKMKSAFINGIVIDSMAIAKVPIAYRPSMVEVEK